MKKSRLIISVFFITIALTGKTQTIELPSLSADRPGVATPPSLMLPKLFQIETGFSKEKIKSENTF